MKFLEKPAGSHKIATATTRLPTGLAGCWELTSGNSGIKLIGFSESGGSYVADGPADFEVSANGKELKWRHLYYDRVIGKGQSYYGVWAERNYPSGQVYFGADGNALWHEPDFGLRGCHTLVSGSEDCGRLLYWERRATVTADEATGILTYLLEWGTVSATFYSVAGDSLKLSRPEGEWTFRRADCQMTLW